MADNPHGARRARPMSPFVTVYRWTPTMASSITHRVTGVGLALGMAVIAWWLMAAARGPETYATFIALAASPLGLVVLFGFAWALSFHLLNGIRHLAWDLGYGFEKRTATQTGSLVYVLSVVLAVAAFAFAWMGYGGYLQ